jgi:hypothetical protein
MTACHPSTSDSEIASFVKTVSMFASCDGDPIKSIKVKNKVPEETQNRRKHISCLQPVDVSHPDDDRSFLDTAKTSACASSSHLGERKRRLPASIVQDAEDVMKHVSLRLRTSSMWLRQDAAMFEAQAARLERSVTQFQ